MARVGVAKFLGCEKTLVKNPSEAVGPYKPLMGDKLLNCFKGLKESLCWTFKYYYKYKKGEAMDAEKKKTKT